MFAVKGWNVSAAALKTQTDPVPEISVSKDNEESAETKKRKRGEKKAPTAQVTDANVGDLWETTIDGKKPKRDRKKQKTEEPTKDEEMKHVPAAAEKNATPKVEKVDKVVKAKVAKDEKSKIDDEEKPKVENEEKQKAEKKKKGKEAPTPNKIAAQAFLKAEATLAAEPLSADYKNKRQRQLEKRAIREQAIANGEIPAPVEQPAKPSRNDLKKKKKDAKEASAVAETAPPAAPVLPVAPKLTPMQAAMRQKLISARFRHLNETLYTAPSTASLDLFSQNPEMFEDYHSGFRQQVTTWPENPVDSFVRQIRERGAVKPPKSQKQMFRDKKKSKGGPGDDGEKVEGIGEVIPRTHGTAIFADLGCGDARLAQTLTESGDVTKLNLKIHSYDLQSPSKFVTKADVANLPLADGSVDVAIFCLALMGTNWIDFVEEAYRILHWKGELWIAEIKSRFGRVGGDGKTKSGPGKPVEHSVGGKRKLALLKKKEEKEALVKDERDEEEALRTEVDDAPSANSREETDVTGFIEVLKRRGFVLKNENSVDLRNKMFVRLEFIKAAAPVVGKNATEEDSRSDKKGGDTWQRKDRKKFIENDSKKEEVSVEDEAKVLKPCLYKIR